MKKFKIYGLAFEQKAGLPIVVLKDEDGDSILPIQIGMTEAIEIAREIKQIQDDAGNEFVKIRPSTHDLLKNVLDELTTPVKKIVITDLRDNIFFAEIYLQTNGSVKKIDSRPSDAMALALKFQVPIFVEEIVMKKTAQFDDEGKKGGKDWKKRLEDLDLENFGNFKFT